MRRQHSAILAALLLVLLSACKQRQGDIPPGELAPAADRTNQSTQGPAPALPAVSAADAAQIEALAFLVAINEQEVAAAEQARGKQVDPRVRAYADLMHEEHSRDLVQAQATAVTANLRLVDSPEVSAFRARGQADLERMAALDEDDYADAYIEAAVVGHAESLALIDDRFLVAASNPAVRQHLATTRAHLEEHLQAARDLQGKPQ